MEVPPAYIRVTELIQVGSRPPLECVIQRPILSNGEFPEVLCIHGVLHAAWCYDNFLNYFSANGIVATAISLRGHGRSEGVLVKASLEDHVQDLKEFIDAVYTTRKPFIIAHSAGGGLFQRLLHEYPGQEFPGVCLMGSFPPWGGAKGFSRWAHHMPKVAVEAMTHRDRPQYTYVGNPERFKKSMFDSDTPIELVEKYWEHLETTESNKWPLRLLAKFADPQNELNRKIPKLIIGGGSDAIFAPPDMIRMGEFYGCEAVIFEGIGHDLMLDLKWEEVAKHLVVWMKSLYRKEHSITSSLRE